MTEPTALALSHQPALSSPQLLAPWPGLRAIDQALGGFIQDLNGRLGGEADALLGLCAALVSQELGQGHVCLPLSQLPARLAALAAKAELPMDWQARVTDIEALSAWLRAQPVVGADEMAERPLVLARGRLYLARYFAFEQQLVHWLQAAQAPLLLTVPEDQLAAWLADLFAPVPQTVLKAWQQVRGERPDLAIIPFARQWLDVTEGAELDWPALTALLEAQDPARLAQELPARVPAAACLNWQKLAVATALSGRFTLISGGPGTGKTTTVARLLALLQRQALATGAALRIRLAAPTGKAAARLTESLGRAIDELAHGWPEVCDALPRQAATLHRLLGAVPGRRGFRHHADNPLVLDVLVVDEASMVDLPLMARLLAALPEGARLILLGDKDQLSSVEAGAVLGDICGLSRSGMSPEQGRWLARLTGYDLAPWCQASGPALRDRICLLRKSWRFDGQSGIGRLARAVNLGQTDQVAALLDQPPADLAFHGGEDRLSSLLAAAVAGYRPYLDCLAQGPCDAERAANALALFNRCRVLCAVRDGSWGVGPLGLTIARALQQAGCLLPEGDWYVGRPVMITQNDHGLGLYNGDIGLTAFDGQRLRVWFQLPDGRVHGFLPSRLPPHESALAMTVHKSQGSEFDHTLLVLPDSPLPVLTRELLYTGITRAKGRLSLFAPRPLLLQTLGRLTERASGLPLALAERSL